MFKYIWVIEMGYDENELRAIVKEDAAFVAEVAGIDIGGFDMQADYINNLVGANIRSERIRAGLTQAELGARIGVTGSMVSQYESNAAYARRPKWKTLERIAQALNISVVRLIAIPPEQTFWTTRFRKGLSAVLEAVDPVDAKDSGFDLNHALSIASGEAGFTFEDACQLCEELGCSPNELLNWEAAHELPPDTQKASSEDE